MFGFKPRGGICVLVCAGLLVSMGPSAALAADRVPLSRGQTLYATAYSYIRLADSKRRFPVTSTLVIRNVDLVHPIIVTTADYRDSKGAHLKHYVNDPITVQPLASVEFVVTESDPSGGHSPSFIIKWKADRLVKAPVVESLVIGDSARGISFVGRAWVIEEAGDPESADEMRSKTD